MTPQPPDPASEVSRAPAGAPALGVHEPVLPWPSPPFCEFVDPAAGAGTEPCLLLLRDGDQASGALVDFQPDEELLKFQPAGALSASSVAFSTLVAVQLQRPVTLRARALELRQVGQPLSAASQRQPFSLQLADGKSFQGESVGFVQEEFGLFLFVPEKNDTVMRWFVPRGAAQRTRIGKPIGQMLVEGNLASAGMVDAALQKQRALRARRLGDYLTDNQIVSPEQLAAALKQQRVQPVQKLGETLLELGYLTQAELDEALAIEARDRSIPLGRILADMGVVEAGVVNGVMARKLGIPFVDLKSFRIPPGVLERVPAAVAKRYQILPVAETDSTLVVAVENPMNMGKMEELRFVTGLKLLPVMASADDIRAALERYYGARQAGSTAARKRTELEIGELTYRLATESADTELNEQQASEEDSTLVRLVNKMIVDAVEQRASDIHIEANPAGKDLRVRFRRDGVLLTYLEMPARFRKALVSRLKIMSQLDITERRKPQDGKIEFKRFGPLDVELRVATIPTANGLEDVVLRVLAAATPLAIEELGFDAHALAQVKGLIARPHGLFLVCGPTGSGKTTTLHSLLGFLNTSERKIWTAEDPIEITQPGLRQVQVNAKIGWTFAAAMRSFMRADPDVIMVGEMRDAETAKIGIEASLTGHLVLSTLHTNSAVESVVRLLDLGMDPFNFADALLGVLAQRLVRKLCSYCRVAYVPGPGEIEELGGMQQPGLTLYRAHGCARCDRIGYKGRIAVYELLAADAAVKRLVQTRAPVAEIAAAAGATGMRSLRQDAIDKVILGLTDLHQVRTV